MLEELHDKLYRKICYDYDATNKYVETMLSPNNSPGKSFFRTENVTVTKDTNDVVTLNIHKNRSAKEMDEMRTNTVSEYFLTDTVKDVLKSNGLKPLSIICSNYCPFSGGGDIAMLSFNNSAVIATQQSKEISVHL